MHKRSLKLKNKIQFEMINGSFLNLLKNDFVIRKNKHERKLQS